MQIFRKKEPEKPSAPGVEGKKVKIPDATSVLAALDNERNGKKLLLCVCGRESCFWTQILRTRG